VVVCVVVVCVVVVVFDVVVFELVVVFDVEVFVVFVVLCVLCFVGLWWAFVLVVDDVLEVVAEATALVVLDFELEPHAPSVNAAARTARTVVTPVFTVGQLTERRAAQ